MRRPINRRAFLRGAGRSIIALPLLDAMSFAGKARASTAPPKRFILLFSKNGTVWNEFRPQGFGVSPDQALPTGALAGKRITSQFRGHEDRLLLMEGLNDICAHPPGGPVGPTNGAHIVSVITHATGRKPTAFDTSTSAAQGATGPSFDALKNTWSPP